MSYLTDDELAAIQHMDRSTPYVITGISKGFFSVARHYGGMTYQGREYVYIPPTDECIRMDVIKAVAKMRKKPKAKPVETVDMFAATHQGGAE